MRSVGRLCGVESLWLLVKESNYGSRRFLVAVDGDQRAVARRHGKERSRPWAGRRRYSTEVALDEVLDVFLVEIPNRDNGHEVGTVPCIIEPPSSRRLLRLE